MATDKPESIDDVEEDLETLDTALNELDANGVNAREDELAGAIDFFERLLDVEAPEDSDVPPEQIDSEKEDARQIRNAIQEVAVGEPTDDDVSLAKGGIEAVIKQIQLLMFESLAMSMDE